MKGSNKSPFGAFSLVELLLVVGVAALLFVGGFFLLAKAKQRAIHISCLNTLKQCQLSFIVWSGDHNGQFPMEVSTNLGGSLEWVTGGNAFRHFQAISNELSTPMVTRCPTDTRKGATNFGGDFRNENISYFVGLNASETNVQAWLCGDRNITNGFASEHTILTLKSGQSAGWNNELHNQCGNVAAVDGSVQQIPNFDLRNMMKETGWSNRVALPE